MTTFSDIQNLCNAVSDWLIQKSIIQLKPTRQYPVPVVTSSVIAEPVNLAESLDRIFPSVFRDTSPHLWSVSVVGTEGKLR